MGQSNLEMLEGIKEFLFWIMMQTSKLYFPFNVAPYWYISIRYQLRLLSVQLLKESV